MNGKGWSAWILSAASVAVAGCSPMGDGSGKAQSTAVAPPAPSVDGTTRAPSSEAVKPPPAASDVVPEILRAVPAGFYVLRGECYRIGDFFLAGQPSGPDYAKAMELGVKSVLNLRMEREHDGLGFDPEYTVKELGLAYYGVQVSPKTMDDAKAELLLATIEKAEKPLLIHDSNGNRVWGLWALYAGLKHGVPVSETKQAAAKLGVESLVIEDFVRDYLKRKAPKP